MRKILALSLLLSIVGAPTSHAADCSTKACIDVYVQDGHIVIEAHKGSGPKASSSTSASTAKATRKPRPPKPKPTSTVKTTTRKPRVTHPRKAATKRASSPAVSLQDRLIESIPTTGISYQPSFSPLIKTPVFFWSDVPTVFTKKVEILGEVVDLRLRPSFVWHYGDGVIFTTRDVGAAFPNGKIQHTYSKPGHYLIELITSWDGEFTIGGVSTPIPSEIVTVSVLPITVVAAPTRFVN